MLSSAPHWAREKICGSGVTPPRAAGPAAEVVSAVSSAARWLTVREGVPGSITASRRSPGRARRPSRVSGSGPCSSWYSSADQPDHSPSVRVRAAMLRSSSATSAPGAQVTPTMPSPVTASGRLTSRWPPPGTARAAAVPVSDTSRTTGSTTVAGSVAVLRATWAYADSTPTSEPVPEIVTPAGGWRTTSRLIRLAAGVSTASTAPRASSCWQAVTNRDRKSDIEDLCVRGEVHTARNFHTSHTGHGRVRE